MSMNSNSRKNYEKAPIIEAMLDLRFVPQSGFDFAKLETSVPDKLSLLYPHVKKQVHSEFRADMAHNHSQSYEVLRLSSADGSKILQLRPDAFVFSQLAPYSCWEKFIAEARDNLSIFLKESSLKYITRTAVRFINRFDFPGSSVELSDYLNIYLQSPPSFDMRSFAMQSIFAQDDLRSMLVLRQALVPPLKADTVSILLDFDLFSEEMRPCTDVFWGFLEQLHTRKNEVFEGSITQKTRELIS